MRSSATRRCATLRTEPRALAAGRPHGAVELDTTGLRVDEVVARIVGLVEAGVKSRAHGGRGGLSQRRQVHARQPVVGHSRGRGARAVGVTRDRKEIDADWNGLGFTLMDTGGVDFAGEHDMPEEIRGQALIALAEAHLTVMVVDARAGLRAGDEELARELRGAQPGDRGRQQGRRRGADRPSPRSSTGWGWATRCPCRPTRASGPATCSTAWWGA